MFDEYLHATADLPAREAAVTLGVDDTYISKLRTGWRPSRVREELWRNLVGALTKPTYGVVRESGVGYRGESREYYRGKQDTLMAMMRWVVDQQAQIGAYLRHPDERPPTPTVDEVEDEAAVLKQLPVPDPQQAGKKRRA